MTLICQACNLEEPGSGNGMFGMQAALVCCIDVDPWCLIEQFIQGIFGAI